MARFDLRLSDREFWRSTLYELHLLIERWQAEQKFRAKLAGAETTEQDHYLCPDELRHRFDLIKASRVSAANQRAQRSG